MKDKTEIWGQEYSIVNGEWPEVFNSPYGLFSTSKLQLSFSCPNCSETCHYLLDTGEAEGFVFGGIPDDRVPVSLTKWEECNRCGLKFCLQVLESDRMIRVKCNAGHEIESLTLRQGQTGSLSDFSKYLALFDGAGARFLSMSNAVKRVLSLADDISKDVLQQSLWRMAYISCFTSLELYLCDKLVDTIMEEQESLYRAFAHYSGLKTGMIVKLFLDHMEKEYSSERLLENLKQRIVAHLRNNERYSDYDRVQKIYQEIINERIRFKKDLVQSLIEKKERRNDLTHRWDKDRMGDEFRLTAAEVKEVHATVFNFVDDLGEQINDRQEKEKI